MEGGNKGTVCVIGGTGYIASWLIFRLLQHGYSVNTTIRSPPDSKREVSYLTDLPGASERLRVFNADIDKPGSFDAAIEGCIGVFIVAHFLDFGGKETGEETTKKSINATIMVLEACLKAGTVKRVVYTSAASTIFYYNKKGSDSETVDENTWTDIDHVKSLNPIGGAAYAITKTLTEKACLQFAENHGLEIVTVIPPWVHGPFVCPNLPYSVRGCMALIFGDEVLYKHITSMRMVHTDDMAEAQIFLLEYPDAKGRYICSAVEVTLQNLGEFLAAKYPEYQIPSLEYLKEIKGMKYPGLSSKKLLDTGFKFNYGLKEMYDHAIKCCKEKGFL